MLVPLFFLGVGALFAGFLFKETFIGHHNNDFWQTSIFFTNEIIQVQAISPQINAEINPKPKVDKLVLSAERSPLNISLAIFPNIKVDCFSEIIDFYKKFPSGWGWCIFSKVEPTTHS